MLPYTWRHISYLSRSVGLKKTTRRNQLNKLNQLIDKIATVRASVTALDCRLGI